jgi:MFS superfamily sulfate permease-like transporter
MKMTKNTIFQLADLYSSLVVFIVALPLCLGIAHASGVSPLAGIVAGISGGIIVGLVSKSSLSVSGPAAGLIVVITTAISSLNGDLNLLFASIVVAGLLQILFGFFKFGFLGEFVPSSVIKGMMAAIGFILIFKQFPHLIGFDKDYEGDESFFQEDGHNTFSELLYSSTHTEAVFIGVICLLTLIFFESKYIKKSTVLSKIPSLLLVVVLGVILNQLSHFIGISEQLEGEHLIQLPNLIKSEEPIYFLFFHTSDFLHPLVLLNGVIIAVVASLESLLNLEASDKMDVQKRVTPANRELIAQGLGNTVSGLFGGLPVTSVVVRSSANYFAGAKTKSSTILHGFWLVFAVVFFANTLNLIPLSALAAILIMVGYKLTKPSVFKAIWKAGLAQFLPFIATFLGVVFTDLLKGVVIGIIVGLYYVIRSNFHSAIRVTKGDNKDYLIRFRKEVSFLNKSLLKRELAQINSDSFVLIDATKCEFMDPDIIEIIRDFNVFSASKNIVVEFNKNDWGEIPKYFQNISI